MDTIESIIAKIQKLRALSQSDNPNEAAAAARKADELIGRYQLEEADLIAKGEKTDEPIRIASDRHMYQSGRIMLWIYELATVLCEHYGCAYYTDSIYDPSKVFAKNPRAKRATFKAFVLVGRASDVEIIQYMFDWLRPEIERLTRIHAYGQGMQYSQNFSLGVVNGIRLQLQAEHDKLRSDNENRSAAIVLLDNRHKEAIQYMNTAVKLKSAGSSHLGGDADAFASGTAKGKTIQLKKGIGSASDSKRLK